MTEPGFAGPLVPKAMRNIRRFALATGWPAPPRAAAAVSPVGAGRPEAGIPSPDLGNWQDAAGKTMKAWVRA